MKVYYYKILLLCIFMSLIVQGAPTWGEDRGLLYGVLTVPNAVDIYDPQQLREVGRILVGKSPMNIAISNDRKWLAVSHRVGLDVIWIIDRKKREVVHKVAIYLTRYRQRGEIFLLFSQNGEKLYAVDSKTGFLDIISASNWKLVKKVALGDHPQNPILSPDGRLLYIPNLYSRDVTIVDTEQDIVVDSLKIDGFPSAVALSAKGKTIYVADRRNHRVLFIDSASRNIIKEIPVGTAPIYLALSSKKFLYVLNMLSHTLNIINTIKKETIKTLSAGVLPTKMTFNSDGKRLFIASAANSSIGVLDTKKQESLKSIPTDITPAGLVFVPASAD